MNPTPFIIAAALAAGASLAVAPPAWAETLSAKLETQGKPAYIEVGEISARSGNGLLALSIVLANTDNAPREAYWRIKWLDAAGFQVWQDEAWKPLLIQGAARQNIAVSAPTAKATDFRLQLSTPENSKSIF